MTTTEKMLDVVQQLVIDAQSGRLGEVDMNVLQLCGMLHQIIETTPPTAVRQ